ncbi:MAG TPA: c-type cytochrome, partial [Pyrinomonadaceae bacterium]|nr:c-type cytochrome [Pyrinomonadaceae bacterium]
TPVADALAASRELYKTNCAQCHKDDGKGGESVVDGKKINAKDLTGDRMKSRSDSKLYDDIAEGSEDDGMPAFRGKLSDAQINEVVKYIRVELQHAK